MRRLAALLAAIPVGNPPRPAALENATISALAALSALLAHFPRPPAHRSFLRCARRASHSLIAHRTTSLMAARSSSAAIESFRCNSSDSHSVVPIMPSRDSALRFMPNQQYRGAGAPSRLFVAARGLPALEAVKTEAYRAWREAPGEGQ